MSTDLEAVLDHLSAVVEQARAVPMSSSCVVHRDEVLALLDDARATLPSALARAERVLRERDALLARAGQEADDVVASARLEQSRLVEAAAVFTRAQDEADRLLATARADAEAMRLQTEDYVDAKLANFEVVLAKTLATVERGRSRLSGRSDPEPLRSSDPSRRAAATRTSPMRRPARRTTGPTTPTTAIPTATSTATVPDGRAGRC